MSNPSELFEVAQNGKSKFGDNLLIYSNTNDGIIQSDRNILFYAS